MGNEQTTPHKNGHKLLRQYTCPPFRYNGFSKRNNAGRRERSRSHADNEVHAQNTLGDKTPRHSSDSVDDGSSTKDSGYRAPSRHSSSQEEWEYSAGSSCIVEGNTGRKRNSNSLSICSTTNTTTSSNKNGYNNNNNNNSCERKQSPRYTCSPTHVEENMDILPRMLPLKNRKISRAVSVNRSRTRRHSIFVGFSRGSNSNVLTEAKKLLLQESWELILKKNDSNLVIIGLHIYQRVFAAAPELTEVFGIPDSINVEDNLMDHQPFHRSGKLFSSIIGLCVKNIFALEGEMGPVLVMYGRRHYHKVAKGFRVEYLDLFSRCMLDYLTEELMECDLDLDLGTYVQAWELLFDYIMNKMAEGFDVEQAKNEGGQRRRTIF